MSSGKQNEVVDLLHQAILELCRVTLPSDVKYEVDGIVCISLQEKDLVVKLHHHQTLPLDTVDCSPIKEEDNTIHPKISALPTQDEELISMDNIVSIEECSPVALLPSDETTKDSDLLPTDDCNTSDCTPLLCHGEEEDISNMSVSTCISGQHNSDYENSSSTQLAGNEFNELGDSCLGTVMDQSDDSQLENDDNHSHEETTEKPTEKPSMPDIRESSDLTIPSDQTDNELNPTIEEENTHNNIIEGNTSEDANSHSQDEQTEEVKEAIDTSTPEEEVKKAIDSSTPEDEGKEVDTEDTATPEEGREAVNIGDTSTQEEVKAVDTGNTATPAEVKEPVDIGDTANQEEEVKETEDDTESNHMSDIISDILSKLQTETADNSYVQNPPDPNEVSDGESKLFKSDHSVKDSDTESEPLVLGTLFPMSDTEQPAEENVSQVEIDNKVETADGGEEQSKEDTANCGEAEPSKENTAGGDAEQFKEDTANGAEAQTDHASQSQEATDGNNVDTQENMTADSNAVQQEPTEAEVREQPGNDVNGDSTESQGIVNPQEHVLENNHTNSQAEGAQTQKNTDGSQMESSNIGNQGDRENITNDLVARVVSSVLNARGDTVSKVVDTNLHCETCGATMPSIAALVEHNLDFHQSYTCIVCRHTYKHKVNLDLHVLTHKNYPQDTPAAISQTKDFKCGICGSLHDSIKHIEEHFRQSHECIMFLSCLLCKEYFPNPHTFGLHRKYSHGDISENKCTRCGFGFLAKEVSRHSTECGKSFTANKRPAQESNPASDDIEIIGVEISPMKRMKTTHAYTPRSPITAVRATTPTIPILPRGAPPPMHVSPVRMQQYGSPNRSRQPVFTQIRHRTPPTQSPRRAPTWSEPRYSMTAASPNAMNRASPASRARLTDRFNKSTGAGSREQPINLDEDDVAIVGSSTQRGGQASTNSLAMQLLSQHGFLPPKPPETSPLKISSVYSIGSSARNSASQGVIDIRPRSEAELPSAPSANLRCDICQHTFSNIRALIKHNHNIHHSFICVICRSQLPDENSLLVHMNECHYAQ